MGELRLIGDGINENGERVRYFGVTDDLLLMALRRQPRPVGASQEDWDNALRDALSDSEQVVLAEGDGTVFRQPASAHNG